MAAPLLNVYVLSRFTPPIGLFQPAIRGFRICLPVGCGSFPVRAGRSVSYAVGYDIEAPEGYGVQFVAHSMPFDCIEVVVGDDGLQFTNTSDDRDVMLPGGLLVGHVRVFVSEKKPQFYGMAKSIGVIFFRFFFQQLTPGLPDPDDVIAVEFLPGGTWMMPDKPLLVL